MQWLRGQYWEMQREELCAPGLRVSAIKRGPCCLLWLGQTQGFNWNQTKPISPILLHRIIQFEFHGIPLIFTSQDPWWFKWWFMMIHSFHSQSLLIMPWFRYSTRQVSTIILGELKASDVEVGPVWRFTWHVHPTSNLAGAGISWLPRFTKCFDVNYEGW